MLKAIVKIIKEIYNYQQYIPLSQEDFERQITIWPYYENGEWLFDDYTVKLKKEPICNFDELIGYFFTPKQLKNKRVLITFSASPFPGCFMIVHISEQWGGNWYYSGDLDEEIWLCGALFLYYPSAPNELYIRISRR